MKIDLGQAVRISSEDLVNAQRGQGVPLSKGAVSKPGQSQPEHVGPKRDSDSVTLTAGRLVQKTASYSMSEIKKRADEAAERLSSDHSQKSDAEATHIQSVNEERGDLDREERIEIARLRMNTGFYDRPDVIDELARRISESM